eukprot:Pgem_evm3s17627
MIEVGLYDLFFPCEQSVKYDQATTLRLGAKGVRLIRESLDDSIKDNMGKYDIKQPHTVLEAIYQAFGRKTLSTFVQAIEQLSLAQRQPDDTIQQYDNKLTNLEQTIIRNNTIPQITELIPIFTEILKHNAMIYRCGEQFKNTTTALEQEYNRQNSQLNYQDVLNRMLDAENDLKITNTKAHAMHHTEGTLMNTQANKTNTTQPRGQPRQQSDKCYRCNGTHDSEVCYFKDKDCHYCNKQGHCLRACRQRLRDLQSGYGQPRRENQAHFNDKDDNGNSTTNKERRSQNKDKEQEEE